MNKDHTFRDAAGTVGQIRDSLQALVGARPPSTRQLVEDTGAVSDTVSTWCAAECELASIGELLASVGDLLVAVANALEEGGTDTESVVRRARAIASAGARTVRREAKQSLAPEDDSGGIRGGLAPWQIRQLKTHIQANLDGALRVGDLARLVRLSPWHFARAFTSSFGCSPHRFVMLRRVERSQGLLLTTDAPLHQIALECGLADQSHFSRTFLRFVGETPAQWRKARATHPT
jgi:AraC family transcriptional regulator